MRGGKIPVAFVGALLLLFVLYLVASSIQKNKVKHKINATRVVAAKDQELIHQKAIQQKPEIDRLNSLHDEYVSTQNPYLLIEMGDTWRKGAYPRFKSNKENAIKYYDLAADCGNKEIANLAIAKYAEAHRDNIPEEDDVGLYLTDIYYDTVAETANEAELPVVDNAIDNHMVFLNDTQNVHDHYLNKIAKKNIDRLKSEYETVFSSHSANPETIRSLFIEMLYNSDKLDTYQKALIANVLDTMSNDYEQFGCGELDLLFLVHSYIAGQPNKADLFHNLFLQLLDCYSDGSIVCGTGRMARVIAIIGDQEGFDDSRNIYYIKSELEQLAAKIRTDILDTLSQDDLNAYNSGEDGSANIVDKIKSKYLETIKAEYCDKLGIDYNILLPLIEINMMSF